MVYNHSVDKMYAVVETEIGRFCICEEIVKNLCDNYDLKTPVMRTDVSGCENVSRDLMFCKFLIEYSSAVIGFDVRFGAVPCEHEVRRGVAKNLDEFLDSNCAIAVLQGTRRTGKTVLMDQAINKRVKEGRKVCKITLHQGEITGDDLRIYMLAILRHVDDLFVDEITYVQDNFSFLTTFSDSGVLQETKKLVLAGTDSAVFIGLLSSILYKRVWVIPTTYVPYQDFVNIYGFDNSLDVLKCMGVMGSSEEYEKAHDLGDIENYKKEGLDYVGTAIIDNLFNAFSKTSIANRYPYLASLFYENSQSLRLLIMEWLQEYGKALVLDSVAKSSYTGVDSVIKFLQGRYSVNKTLYDEDQINDLERYFTDLGCLVSYPVYNSGTNKNRYVQVLLPFVVRYGIACEILMDMRKEDFWDEQIEKLLVSGIQDILLEIMEDLEKHDGRVIDK